MNHKRYFRLSIEESEEGAGVTVSANADLDFMLKNLVSAMVEHDVLFDILSKSVEAAVKTRILAEQVGISPAKLMEKLGGLSVEHSESSVKTVPVSEQEDTVKEDVPLDEKLDDKLINEIKNILRGGN